MFPTAYMGENEILRISSLNKRKALDVLAPDFLFDLVALIDFMRLSLRKGAHAALSGAAWQEIRVARLFQPM
jgi:hypothetical protein